VLVNRRVARVPTAAGAPKATAATPAAPAGNRPVPRSVAVPTLAGLVELAIEPATAALLGCAAGPARLARAWPRRDGSLAVELRDAHGAVLAGQWRADPDDVRGIARQTTAAGPGGCAVVATAGGRWFVLQVRADRRLAGLGAALQRPGAALVGHRAEQRAVVRVHGAHVKVTRPQRTAAAGRAAAALHAAAVPAGTPVHGAAQETGVLERWPALLTPHAPALAGRVAARAAPVPRALLNAPATAPVPLHRDLHDGQILVDANGDVALLDLDTLAAGEAALDVGQPPGPPRACRAPGSLRARARGRGRGGVSGRLRRAPAVRPSRRPRRRRRRAAASGLRARLPSRARGASRRVAGACGRAASGHSLRRLEQATV
jgi:hypothetical protein